MAFEVGDSVLVKTAEELCKLYRCSEDDLFEQSHDHVVFVPEMRYQAGNEYEIEAVSLLRSAVVKLSGSGYWWPVSALESLEPAGVNIDDFLNLISPPTKE